MRFRRSIGFVYRIHPLLFAAYPSIALLAVNLGEILPSNVLRPLGASLIFALFAWGGSLAVSRDWDKSALLTLAVLVLFFSYGHVYGLVKNWNIAGFIIGRHRLLLLLWGILFLGVTVWVFRYKGKLEAAGKIASVIAISLVAIPAFNVGSYHLPELLRRPQKDEAYQPVLQQNLEQTLPDVYYIILDAYGRSDVLKDLYGYDNSNFIAYLKDEGFFVGEGSHSNYNQTVLSLASSLNMKYVNDVADQMGKESTDRRPLEEMIAHSEVLDIFQSLGYGFVTFETGSLITQIPDSSIYLAPDYQNLSQENALMKGFYLNDFEGLFLKTTMARIWFDEYLSRHSEISNFAIEFPYIKHRSRVLYTFEQLGEIPNWDGNYFVFAHILSPHPPFVFDSRGEMIPHNDPISFQDTGCCLQEEYISGYRDQAAYITKQLQQTLDQILGKSETPPIIILQGDHGPGAFYDGETMDETKTYDRMSILNAYYFPQPAGQFLYADITPVNSFRLLFSTQFGMDFPLLPDTCYFSPGAFTYDISELPSDWLKK